MTSSDTSNAMNGLGKVIPRDDTLVGEVIDTRHYTLIDGSKDSHSQITGISRSTNLIKDHTQFRFLLTQTNHRLHEIIAKGRVQPRCTDNHRPFATLLRSLLTLKFCRAIDTVRTCRLILSIGGVIRAVKHIVCRDLNHPTTTFLHSSSQIARGYRVQFPTEFLIIFRLVNCGIGSTIHDTIYLVILYKFHDGSLVGNIELSHICIKIAMLGILLLQQLHLISQLAVTSCN